MATKKHFSKGLQAMALLAGVTAFTACNDKYHYDPNYQKEVYATSWAEKFGEIDPNQDWCMAEQAKANLGIYGMDALSEYTLKIYTDNPLSNPDAMLVASVPVTTDETGSAEASLNVDVVKGQTVYYACYQDKDNRRNIKPVGLIDGVIDATFGRMATRASENSDGVVVPSVNIAEDNVDSKYSQAKEVNSTNAVANWSDGEDFAQVLKIGAGNTWNGPINVSASELGLGRTIYVDGTWNLSGESRLGGTGLIVVHAGGEIVIPAGSTLRTDNAGRLVVLPGGKVTGEGLVEFANGSGASYQYNGGTMNIGTLDINFGLFYNYGTANITTLYGPSTEGTYINQGNTVVGNAPYGSNTANLRIKNACQFEVTGDLCCRDIEMGQSSYMLVKGNLRMSGSEDGTAKSPEALMAKSSLFEVKGGVALNNASIVGPTDGWAVCQFGKIGDPQGICATNYTTSWSTGSERVKEGVVINNLYISIDEVEENINYYGPSPYGKFTMIMMNGKIYDAANVWTGSENITVANYRAGVQTGNGNAVLVNKGEANVTIPEGCSPGYTPIIPTPTPETPLLFILACEDLGSTDDYDFNDVVFGVSHVAGEAKATVTALAAGGTLASTISYNGQNIGEIHSLLGSQSTTSMINTTSITATGTPVEITVPSNWSFVESYKYFKIAVEDGENTVEVSAPTKGSAPQMIIVPAAWEWPIERTKIEDAYPGFINWNADATVANWNATKVASKVVKR